VVFALPTAASRVPSAR